MDLYKSTSKLVSRNKSSNVFNVQGGPYSTGIWQPYNAAHVRRTRACFNQRKTQFFHVDNNNHIAWFK